MDSYSKTEIDTKLDLAEATTKHYFQKLLNEFEKTELKLDANQKALQNDFNWLKLLVMASLVAIIASKFFHI
jgi:hypothetical protein